MIKEEKDYNYLSEKFLDKRPEGDTDLRQIQNVLLRILKIFHCICEDNNLTYFLTAGTLLGAVRHGGFIPWDDDIDVVMPREDYDRFIKIAEGILPDEFFFQCKETVPKFKNNILRIVDRKSTAISMHKKEEDYKWHMGLFIDIFPMDYTNHPKVARFFLNFFYYNVNNNNLRFIVKFFRHLFVFILRKKNVFKLAKYCLSLGKKENKKYMCYGFDANTHIDNMPFTVDDFFPLKKMSFEGFEFYIPNNYNSVLTKEFGDYMKIPPEEERISHFKEVRINSKCKFEMDLSKGDNKF